MATSKELLLDVLSAQLIIAGWTVKQGNFGYWLEISGSSRRTIEVHVGDDVTVYYCYVDKPLLSHAGTNKISLNDPNVFDVIAEKTKTWITGDW